MRVPTLLLSAFVSLLAVSDALADQPTAPPLPAAEDAPATAEGAKADAPAAADALVRMVLKDGQVLRGTLEGMSEGKYHLALVGGGTVMIPREAVREIVHDKDAVTSSTGEVWFADPNRTRYFYGPSAMMLRKGQAYFSQKELFFSSVGYGITDNFSVLAGTVAPAWLAGPSGMNAILALKGGAPVAENLHVAAGLEFLALPNFTFGSSSQPLAAGFLFGSGTWGKGDRHLTLSIGKPLLLELSAGEVSSMDLITTLSGSIRMHRHIGLITENWLVLVDVARGQVGSAHAFGARFMLETIAADVGFVWIGAGSGSGYGMMPVPIPWVDFTWNFSLGES